MVAVSTMQQLLYRLLAASNAPLPVMGIKQWSSRLTLAQREVLAGLPSPTAEPESVVSVMKAVRTAFAQDGRSAVEAHGVVWPGTVDDAVAAYWAAEGLL